MFNKYVYYHHLLYPIIKKNLQQVWKLKKQKPLKTPKKTKQNNMDDKPNLKLIQNQGLSMIKNHAVGWVGEYGN